MANVQVILASNWLR